VQFKLGPVNADLDVGKRGACDFRDFLEGEPFEFSQQQGFAVIVRKLFDRPVKMRMCIAMS
jgi:hypothetical protein